MAITLRLTGKTMVAAGTMAFRFAKPEGFMYTAGQAADWTLVHPTKTDKEGNKRSFTIASAPYEPELMLATRLRESAFKESLRDSLPGAEVSLDGPWGELTLHEDASVPAVFLTGGIGITPFRSMVLQAAHNRLKHSLFLFYANRRPEDAVFLDEMRAAERADIKFTFVPTMTEMEKSSMAWSGERGHIDEAMLRRQLAELNAPIYYISGPPKMVEAMQKMLDGAGVKKECVKTENFDGY